MIISPSLLAGDLLSIKEELEHFEAISDIWIHLDVMDGHFVPNLTFGQVILKNISKYSSKKLDAHFMVTNPSFYIETCKDYGFYNFTFHFEATEDIKKCLFLVEKAKKYYPSVGISIRPKTDLAVLSDELLLKIDLLLLMSVEPGFAGQSFIESSLEKLARLNNKKNELNAKFMIQVDGGVDNTNASKLISLGCQNLVSGAYIFKDGSCTYKEKISSLR